VVELIKKLKEGKKVKQNLDQYFNKVDAKGPLYVKDENGPDTYIDDVRQDAFEKFSDIRRRAES